MRRQAMDKKIKFRRIGIGILVLIILLLVTFLMGYSARNKNSSPKVTTDLISQRLMAAQDLVTVEYYYTNMGQFEHQNDFYGWRVPLTKKGFIVSYDGIIKAGIDMGEVQVNLSGDSLELTIPEAKIISHEMNQESIEVFDESRNIFNPISITDFTGFTNDQRVKIEDKAISNGLLTEAKERGEDTLKTWLLVNTDITGDLSIIVK